MKKFISLLAVLALVTVVSSTSFAAVDLTTQSVADFSGQGQITLTFVLKKISDNSEVSSIQWDIASIPLKTVTENYTTSTVYAELSSNVTKANGAIYMYQNNKADGTYKANTGRTDGAKTVYNGMVNTATHGGEVRGFLPMVYQITTTKATPTFGANPQSVEGTRYFNDQDDTGFASNMNYVTIANVGGLVKGINNDGCYNFPNGETSGYMYFGAQFSNIYGGDVWGTDKIKIVSSAE